MSEGMSQLEAYRHLLDVAESIIQSVDIDKQIVAKYDALKRGIKSKIKIYKQEKTQQQTYHIQIYKHVLQNITTCLHQFQSQVQNSESSLFHKSLLVFKNTFNQQIDKYTQFENDKRKQQIKIQTAYLTNVVNDIAGRLQNLQLMLQIHKKMQDIVQQAARKEVFYRQRQLDYEEKIKKTGKQLEKIKNVDGYLKQVEIVKGHQQQLKILEKQLKLWIGQII